MTTSLLTDHFLPDALASLRAQSTLRQRMQLTAAQRAEAERLSPFLGISMQQVYRGLRSGELSLTTK